MGHIYTTLVTYAPITHGVMASLATKRRVCAICGEQLASAAYFRHLHDCNGTACPGKKKKLLLMSDVRVEEESRLADESSLEDIVDSDSSLDTTFCLSESDLSACQEELGTGLNSVSELDSELSSSVHFSSDEDGSSLEEEVWDISLSDSDEDTDATGEVSSKLVHAVSVFLMFFHLFYNVSERAMTALLRFIRSLLGYLATVCGIPRLVELAKAIPMSLATIRKMFNPMVEFVEYVACPRCSKLYTLGEACSYSCIWKKCRVKAL